MKGKYATEILSEAAIVNNFDMTLGAMMLMSDDAPMVKEPMPSQKRKEKAV